ncbi:Kinase protein with adenine nucleotide alpha hydrolases-like domain, putative isoform 4 [Hibiscus syriacus]|uniref:Kinase protein with adenine nucleotide alpha hydrolases-like domain, putative isoform 4 n=1 Tax=Hibiscus syriacus TaxID=106335 RepID=A0A6A3B7S2_HIBSY|nr:Kinase protein with adenine nucleotide alpha hydrolases-like domain, putative isoform 4 [Hibiscus syriacus]
MLNDKKKNVLVGIRLDSQSRELLNWAIVKVAEPGDRVVAVHVSRCSDHSLESYLEAYEGLCALKKVELKGRICNGRSTREVLIQEAKNYAAVTVVVGVGKHGALGGWTAIARYCAKQLPTTTNVLAINNGKIIFTRSNNNKLPGMEGDPRPSFRPSENLGTKEWQSEYGDSDVGFEISSFEGIQRSKDGSRTSSDDSKSESFSVINEGTKVSSSSNSLFAGDSMEYKPGWPLLLKGSSATPQVKLARNISVVQWVMNLPCRSLHHSPQSSTNNEIEWSGNGDKNDTSNFSMPYELQKRLETPLRRNSSDCQWFSYEVLKAATAQFSSVNLIGKGGNNCVYKGILPDGNTVAVKILKSSKDAYKDFADEIEIISSLKHKSIRPLVGVCVKDYDLISVYEYSSKGSLAEILHGKNKDKHPLPWEVRYNVAVTIAEGLNYLHNEHSRPVIHRDVKSSNIILSDDFEAKLSDFGLATWGPTASSFLTRADVAGTFGYLAPEYFMYGKLSDKIDVYAFGVVLLELLSGKRPISFGNHEGQQSLVMWAKPMIESGDVKGILDPDLNENINAAQMHRMVVAATLCIKRSARLRPKMNEVLELLRGEKAIEKCSLKQDENKETKNMILMMMKFI